MEKRHIDKIKENITSLVERTRLEDILQPLVDKGVFTANMVEKYQRKSETERNLKRELFLEIPRRGPKAFSKLIEVFDEKGYWELITMLDPTHHLNNPPFVSLSRERAERERISTPVKQLTLTENVTETLKIHVVKSTKFCESTHENIGCYFMKSNNRGITLMINNVDFEHFNYEKPRDGAVVDQENLRELFTQIGFSKFVEHNNLNKQEFENVLKEFSSSSDLKYADCVFVIVASHGKNENNKDYVKCYEGDLISVENIINYFNNKNCPHLLSKPKIFIFQICRGDGHDYGIEGKAEIVEESSSKNSRTQFDGKSTSVTLPTYTDMLIVQSTLPGYASHRDKIVGSWYIRSMCETFMKKAHDTHVEDLFKLVDDNLDNMKNFDPANKSIQKSSYENRSFTKYCYLNPGFFKDGNN